jgi:SAM-dependent methyltransferase
MHPVIFEAFERLLRDADPGGAACAGRVLEIGAMPAADTLLNLPALQGAAVRLGVNLAPASRQPGFEIRQGDANRLAFDDASFDLVLSNSTLEHDRRFWLTLAETRRVLKPGGLLLLGVPGFGGGAGWARFRRLLGRLPLLRGRLAGWRAAELTLARHDMPRDYWRFGEAAAREVLLEDLEPLAVERLLVPPRFLAVGRKP